MYQSGFVSIYGKPNAGKSTLFNKLIGEKLSIISPKIQTTRKTLKGFLSTDEYQIIFIDTPGFIAQPKYELHKKMVAEIDSAKQGTDISILLVDVKNAVEDLQQIVADNNFKKPLLLVLNKIDTISKTQLQEKIELIKVQDQGNHFTDIISVSVSEEKNINELINIILKYLPEHPAYFDKEEISDTSQRSIVAELIREKIFYLYEKEIPYHSAVLVREFKEKSTLIKISADIIIQREQQKIIMIGNKGQKIKQLGTEARLEIENFLEQKVFLELFVKVRHKWRDTPLFLKEFGY